MSHGPKLSQIRGPTGGIDQLAPHLCKRAPRLAQLWARSTLQAKRFMLQRRRLKPLMPRVPQLAGGCGCPPQFCMRTSKTCLAVGRAAGFSVMQS